MGFGEKGLENYWDVRERERERERDRERERERVIKNW